MDYCLGWSGVFWFVLMGVRVLVALLKNWGDRAGLACVNSEVVVSY